jgi:hypothetical protein
MTICHRELVIELHPFLKGSSEQQVQSLTMTAQSGSAAPVGGRYSLPPTTYERYSCPTLLIKLYAGLPRPWGNVVLKLPSDAVFAFELPFSWPICSLIVCYCADTPLV